MKNFLKKKLLFFIPIVLFILFFEIYLRQMQTVYTVKERDMDQGGDKIELLILGNSHSGCGIDPNQFTLNSYNLAQVSQSLYFDKRITLKRIGQLKKLKFVFIGVDYHSLYFSSQGSRDVWSYYGNEINYKNELSFISKYSHLYGYGKLAVHLFMRDLSKKYNIVEALDVENVDLNRKPSKGWFYYDGTDENVMDEIGCLKRADYFNELVENSNEKEDIVRDLENFIYQLKLYKITPILITTPCFAPYRKFINQKKLNETTDLITNLSHKYNVQYWNYFDLPMEQSDFLNCDHLNSHGAEKFSKILNSRLRYN